MTACCVLRAACVCKSKTDDQKLHAAKSPEKASPTKPINFAAAGGLSGGGMGGMAGMAAGAEESDDSSEEEEDDYDEADEEADAKKAAALATRSNVLARARMLVHKAQIIEGEKERELTKNGTEAGPGGLAGLAMAEAAAAAAAAAEAAGGRGKKPKPAKVSLTTASVKAESNFSRYRRQSAFTLAEEKRREDAAEEQKKIESNAVSYLPGCACACACLSAYLPASVWHAPLSSSTN